MNKSLKIILVILLLVFLVFSSNCFAVNIDMNLASNLVDSGYNVVDNDTVSTPTDTTATQNANNDIEPVTNSNLSTDTESATFSNLSSLPESELGLTNILNILLIAVGFVLILLAIAILIKIKK